MVRGDDAAFADRSSEGERRGMLDETNASGGALIAFPLSLQ